MCCWFIILFLLSSQEDEGNHSYRVYTHTHTLSLSLWFNETLSFIIGSAWVSFFSLLESHHHWDTRHVLSEKRSGIDSRQDWKKTSGRMTVKPFPSDPRLLIISSLSLMISVCFNHSIVWKGMMVRMSRNKVRFTPVTSNEKKVVMQEKGERERLLMLQKQDQKRFIMSLGFSREDSVLFLFRVLLCVKW